MSLVADYARLQGQYCTRLGSPFYGALLERVADDVAQAGPLAGVFEGYPHEPIASAMILRLLGIVHREVLDGTLAALARHYPSTGGDGDATAAWPLLRAVVAEREGELRARLVTEAVQTNEVRRTAALVGGFLLVARETGLALRTLEIGASAGLNLWWDRFRYEADDGRVWGDADAAVRFRGGLAGALPFDVRARVAVRGGCDPNPIDPASDAGRLRLLSFVWPDQHERLAMVRAACDVARDAPVVVERANGAPWIEAALARPAPGVATVVYHSIVIQYFAPDDRDRFLAALEAAGRRATPVAPLAWLRMEPGGEQAEVRLTTWPGGVERLVATTGFHGHPVRWCVG